MSKDRENENDGEDGMLPPFQIGGPTFFHKMDEF
jgi:hypothetical protein